MSYNIYCDESCHLEHDNIDVMVLGAVWCSASEIKEVNRRIKEIKAKYGLGIDYELKWTKISSNHYKLYYDIIDYFFDNDDLHFRGVIIPNKKLLNHAEHDQTHDQWYYKMLFILLKNILEPDSDYKIFLDYKDSRGGESVQKLHEVLCNSYYDFSRDIIKDIQLVNSKQVAIIQLTDVLAGALSYLHRHLASNSGKLEIIERIKERSGYSLINNTLYKAKKINLLVWRSRKVDVDD